MTLCIRAHIYLIKNCAEINQTCVYMLLTHKNICFGLFFLTRLNTPADYFMPYNLFNANILRHIALEHLSKFIYSVMKNLARRECAYHSDWRNEKVYILSVRS